MDFSNDRLVLRHLQPEDADWIAREIANPAVQQWLTSPPHPYQISDAHTFIAARAQDPWYRVICADGGGLGVISLTDHDQSPAELGFWLSEAAWGKRYMTESATALLDRYFAEGHSAVTSGWIVGNAASQNVLTKLGFEATGQKSARSEFHDRDVTVDKVRLTATRWQTLRAAR